MLESPNRGAVVVKLSRMFNRALFQQPTLQLIYDTAPIGLAVLSPDCRYLQLNQRLTEICGISVEGHLGRSVRDCVPALAEAVEGIVRSIMSTGEPVSGIEVASQRVDRTEERWWVTYWHPLRNPKGEIVGVNVAAEEITERKRAEAALQTTQNRLIQTEKLASLGQLTAGIAHEIKNPLNFVNNFSSLSVELIGELRELLGGAGLDHSMQAKVNELSDLLQGNLDKVVQHGKRADSIVKNMLLHSRSGSGEHMRVNINTTVSESLKLAYHGARAEQRGFNIRLDESFDPSAGEVDVFPQEITRVLLNLISNGFYATTTRKAELNGVVYQPTLSASTKNLGDSVEICIRDNGTGVPAGVREKMFDPFFTTKPAGEGTGLGLSLSHDVVVKQHGGAIEVETEPGAFTEFRIILPRNATSISSEGRA